MSSLYFRCLYRWLQTKRMSGYPSISLHLIFEISSSQNWFLNWIFAGYTGSKNQVWNRQKIKLKIKLKKSISWTRDFENQVQINRGYGCFTQFQESISISGSLTLKNWATTMMLKPFWIRISKKSWFLSFQYLMKNISFCVFVGIYKKGMRLLKIFFQIVFTMLWCKISCLHQQQYISTICTYMSRLQRHTYFVLVKVN